MRGRREDRVPAWHPWALARKIAQRARSPQVWRRTLRPSLRGWFYGLLRDLLGEPMHVCHRRLAHPLEPARNLTPASGRRDHTASPSASVPLVSQRIHVHRIPRPTFVTFAIAPLQSRRDEENIALILDFEKPKYFCNEGLTGICERRLAGKSVPLNTFKSGDAINHGGASLGREARLNARLTLLLV